MAMEYVIIGIFSVARRIETKAADSRESACRIGREMADQGASHIMVVNLDGNVLGLDSVCGPARGDNA
jgi:hypothetical protein